jgi:hypothetical protein
LVSFSMPGPIRSYVKTEGRPASPKAWLQGRIELRNA